MIDRIIHFAAYHKIYLLVGAVLLILIMMPAKGRVSGTAQKALYLLVIIWVVCFGYKIRTGNDVTSLMHKNDAFNGESRPATVKGGPFNRYYSNDAGRKPKN